MNYLDTVPEDIKTYIFKKYFDGYVIKEIEKIKPEKRWINPSERLCDLCNDVGCLQTGIGVDNIVFLLFNKNLCNCEKECSYECITSQCNFHNILDEHNHITCGNCFMYGFPCLNCGIYYTDSFGVIGLWNCPEYIYGFKRVYTFYFLKSKYKTNNEFDEKKLLMGFFEDDLYYPEN